MGWGDFWGDVTEQVWTMALDYWMTAFTHLIAGLVNWIFGVNGTGNGIVT